MVMGAIIGGASDNISGGTILPLDRHLCCSRALLPQVVVTNGLACKENRKPLSRLDGIVDFTVVHLYIYRLLDTHRKTTTN